MPYPFWDVGIGYGVIMATVAVVHVFVSHFAIGGGLFLVISERAARKADDESRLDFVRRLSRFFTLLTVVFGALTGVAIWFTIGLLHPAATEVLIHNFVWAWAIEWCLFAVEILAAILYFHGWDRLSPRNHMMIGWIYFWSAWLSLVVITGIITFMLTPGEWIETGAFWDAFLNPSYFSSVALRTGICVTLAGLFALLVASRTRDDAVKARMARQCAMWGVIGLVITGATWFWYEMSIPSATRDLVSTRLQNPATARDWFQVLTCVLLGLVAIPALLRPRIWNTALAVIVLLLGLIWFGSFEWYRESIRKPYVIHSYMYGNGTPVGQEARWREEGLLSHVEFRTGDDGADLFRNACRHCHTLDGYMRILPAFAHTDSSYIRSVILNLEQMRGKMPPFMGNEAEAKILADWLWKRADQSALHEARALEGADLGAAVYESRCSRCHVMDGFNDKSPTLATYEPEDLKDLLEDEEGLEGMPPFTGTKAELEALLTYLKRWVGKEGG